MNASAILPIEAMNPVTQSAPLSSATLTEAEILRYARQILLEGWDIDAQTRLKHSHVIIVGVGGLGCPLAETLCRAGVGQLTLIDDDVIDDSNLQRQSLFTPVEVGQSKALVAQQKLQAINDYCAVDAYPIRLTLDNANNIFSFNNKNSLSKLICDCTDNFKTRDHINQIAVNQKIALLTASAIGQTGQLALFEPLLDTGCYHCVFQGEGDGDRTCATSGVLASTTQIMGNLQAQVALSYLGVGDNPIAQTLLLWQGEQLSLRKIGYRKDPNCAICG